MARVHTVRNANEMQLLMSQGAINANDVVILDAPEIGTPRQAFRWDAFAGEAGNWVPVGEDALRTIIDSGEYGQTMQIGTSLYNWLDGRYHKVSGDGPNVIGGEAAEAVTDTAAGTVTPTVEDQSRDLKYFSDRPPISYEDWIAGGGQTEAGINNQGLTTASGADPRDLTDQRIQRVTTNQGIDRGAPGAFDDYLREGTLARAIERTISQASEPTTDPDFMDMSEVRDWFQDESTDPAGREALWRRGIATMGPRMSYPYQKYLESQYDPFGAQYRWAQAPTEYGGDYFGQQDAGNYGFKTYLEGAPGIWSRQQWMNRLAPLAGMDLENIDPSSGFADFLGGFHRQDEEDIIRQATMAGLAGPSKSSLDRALTRRFQAQYMEDPYYKKPGELLRQYAAGGFSRNPFQAYA